MSKDYYSKFIKVMLAVCFAITVIMPLSAQPSGTYAETHELLQQMNEEGRPLDNLAKLFRVGDERIGDLIQALNDPREDVKRSAQIIIRYLGNPEGMDALIKSLKGKNSFTIYGSVPLPLQAWDYDIIHSYFLNKPQQFDRLAHLYLYALALDDSRKAASVLPQMIETSKAAGLEPFIIDALSSREIKAGFKGDDDLAKAVLHASFFLTPQAKKAASAKVISFNHDGSKALVEIYVDRGVLAEELYHVVVIKSDHLWKLFSINPVSMS
jgi:hypothetical protein